MSGALDRRRFLQLSGQFAQLGGGLVLGLVPATGSADEPANPATSTSLAGLAQPFVRIGSDGRITVLAKHLEMGQGIWTGLATVLAEELDADWSTVQVEGAPADKALYKNLAFGFQGTGGSTSMANSWLQLRQAGATAKALLLQAAAARWAVPVAELHATRSVVRHAASGRSAAYGELANEAARLPVPALESLRLKTRAEFTLVGRPVVRLDARDKARGAPLYAMDLQRPGMKVAVLQRPPRFGATLRSVDDAAARAAPGVLDVLRLPRAVAVVAEHSWAALQGRAALRCDWDLAPAESRSSAELFEQFKALAAGDSGLVCHQAGDVDAALAGAAQRVEAVFEAPYLAHAPMEPLCAVGEWTPASAAQPGRCEVWAAFQNVSGDHAALARILGLPLEAVRLHTLQAGGSFGRRATFNSDWISELAELLKASGGRYPVKLMWSREDDLRSGYYRPMNVHRLRAGLDVQGRLVALEQTIVCQSFLFPAPKPGVAQKADPTVFEGHVAARYSVPDARLRWVHPSVGVPVQMYRALGYNHTTFSKEVFIDELARRAGADPLAYRLAMLQQDHPRQAAVLRLVAEKAGWGRPLPRGQALGLAVQEAYKTFVAQVVQLRLLKSPDGKRTLRIERVVCAVDCGLVVNPDGVRAQMEGGVAFGLNLALHGGITLQQGEVQQHNFHDHPALRLVEMPQRIEVHFIESAAEDNAPTGVGEPGSVPVAAALANALSRLTGRPVRRLPLQADDWA